MSEIKLNLLDSHTLVIATVHGSIGDALVAALSAEPVTIDELVAASERFLRSKSIPASLLYRQNRSAIDQVPCDAGILVIDLASRIVMCESTYLLPMREGTIDIYDRAQAKGVTVRYQLADDWIFLRSVEEYQARCQQRLIERASTVQLDVRSVMYGEPLLDFIVQNAKLLASSVATVRDAPNVRPANSVCRPDEQPPYVRYALACRGPINHAFTEEPHDDLLFDAVVDIHRRWLMTQRDDLNGNSPRKVLFAKRNLIDCDLSSRAWQWGYFLEEPPSLSRDTHAYKFAGFGAHEWVMYYDLVRYLIWEAVDRITHHQEVDDHSSAKKQCRELSENKSSQMDGSQAARGSSHAAHGSSINQYSQSQVGHDSSPDVPISFTPGFSPGPSETRFSETVSTVSSGASLIAHLELLKTQWLNDPNPELSFSIPAEIIDNERRRRPEAMTGRSMVVDEECPCCKMMGDESEAGLGIYFTHYDGSNMEYEFAFSWFATLEEWEEEQRRNDEWDRKRKLADQEREGSSTDQLPQDCDIPF